MGKHSDLLAKLAMAKLARVDPVPYDPHTGEEYEIVRLMIDSHTLNQPIANGNLVCNDEETGEPRVYEVYENQVAGVEAMVETATKREMDQVQRDLDWHTTSATVGVDGDDPKNERGCYPSFPASFRHVMHRDMLPFRSVKVIPQPEAKVAANG